MADPSYRHWPTTTESKNAYAPPRVDELDNSFPTQDSPPVGDQVGRSSEQLLSIYNPLNLGSRGVEQGFDFQEDFGFDEDFRFNTPEPPMPSQSNSTPRMMLTPVSIPTTESPSTTSDLTTLVEHLHGKVSTESLSLDQALFISQAASRKIDQVVTTQDFSRSASCPPLAFTAMSQVITLFETSIRPANLLQASSGEGFVIRMGSFQVDSEEQQASLWVQVVLSELSRTAKVVKNLSWAIQKPSPRPSQDRGVYERWSSSITQRIDTLLSVWKNKSG